MDGDLDSFAKTLKKNNPRRGRGGSGAGAGAGAGGRGGRGGRGGGRSSNDGPARGGGGGGRGAQSPQNIVIRAGNVQGGVSKPAYAPKPTFIQTGVQLTVSNLAPSVSEQDLLNAFQKYGGPVKKVEMHYNQHGQSRGSALVVMQTNDGARDAIANMNGVPLDKYPMEIARMSVPRERDASSVRPVSSPASSSPRTILVRGGRQAAVAGGGRGGIKQERGGRRGRGGKKAAGGGMDDDAAFANYFANE